MKALVLGLCIVSTLALVSVPLKTTLPTVSEWRVMHMGSKSREGRGSLIPPSNPKAFHTTEITIGFPPKKFEMLVDLGLDGNWITSESCESFGCYTREGYNNKDSLMHKPTGESIHIAYGEGKGRGKISTDTVSIAGLHVISFNFGELEDVKGGVFLRGPFDGVIGEGQTGDPESQANLVTALFDRHLIDDNSFSISLSAKTGDQMILGAVDPALSHFGFTYHPLLPGTPWSIQMANVRVGEVDLADFAFPVASIDLKVPMFAASSNFTEAINHAIGPIFTNCSNFDELPKITFRSEIADYIVDPVDYVVKLNSDNGMYCVSGFISQTTGKENSLVLGEAFIRKYYTHFDLGNKKVGFASAA